MNDNVGIAERVRRGCIRAALTAYEDAGMRGLCGEARWEDVIQVLHELDLASFVDDRSAVSEVAGEAGEGE